METVKKICSVLLVAGSIILALRGLLSFDVVAWLCAGAWTTMARILYGVFGLAAVGMVVATIGTKKKEIADQK